MKKIHIKQYGRGESVYTRQFVVELPDEFDEKKLNDVTLEEIANGAEVDWELEDSDHNASDSL